MARGLKMLDWDKVVEEYHRVITDCIDPRSSDWFLVSSPLVPFSIIAFYLLLIKKWGPRFMAHREPYKIEPIIIVYNIVQIILCSYITIEGAAIWYKDRYSFTCQPVDHADTETNRKMADLVHLYYVLKISDLLDTVFFVLRKKFNQASFLHVYHHAGMVFAGYCSSLFSLNGHFTLLGVINAFVHVVMYGYYLYTLVFPDKRPSLTLKKSLTILQLVQFAIMMVHNTLPFLVPNCQVHKLFAAMMGVQYAFMFVLFSDFYSKAYLTPKKKVA